MLFYCGRVWGKNTACDSPLLFRRPLIGRGRWSERICFRLGYESVGWGNLDWIWTEMRVEGRHIVIFLLPSRGKWKWEGAALLLDRNSETVNRRCLHYFSRTNILHEVNFLEKLGCLERTWVWVGAEEFNLSASVVDLPSGAPRRKIERKKNAKGKSRQWSRCGVRWASSCNQRGTMTGRRELCGSAYS